MNQISNLTSPLAKHGFESVFVLPNKKSRLPPSLLQDVKTGVKWGFPAIFDNE